MSCPRNAGDASPTITVFTDTRRQYWAYLEGLPSTAAISSVRFGPCVSRAMAVGHAMHLLTSYGLTADVVDMENVIETPPP